MAKKSGFGPNWAGKTTIFRMVVGEETPDESAVPVPKKLTIGHFRQGIEEMQGRSVLLDKAISGKLTRRRSAPPTSEISQVTQLIENVS